jgi:hypothetical protein
MSPPPAASAPTVSFRPRSVSEMVDAAFQLARAYFGPLAVLAAIQAVPGLLIALAQLRLLPTRPGTTLQPERIALLFVFGAVGLCLAAIGYAAQVSAAGDGYVGQPVDAPTALRRALGRAGLVIGANLLAYLWLILPVAIAGGVMFGSVAVGSTNVAVLLLGFAFMIAGLVWAVLLLPRFMLLNAVLMLESTTILGAMRRVGDLAAGQSGRIWKVMALTFTIYFVASLAILGVLVGILRDVQTAQIVGSVVNVVIYPLMSCVFTVLYFDIRIRKEGYDIELMARQLGHADAPPRPAAG